MSQTSGTSTAAEAVRAIADAVRREDLREASALADRALAQGLAHPVFFSVRAMWLEREGREDDALTAYEQARARWPNDSGILNGIGLCLTRLLRLEEAIESFDAAIAIAPNNGATHQRRATALGLAGRALEAEEASRRALELQPDNVDALASLAATAARRSEFAAAKNLAARALEVDPGNATAHVALALADLARDQFAAVEHRLAPLADDAGLSLHGRSVIHALLGDALDGQHRYGEAFAAYAEANAANRKLHAPRFRGHPGAVDQVERLVAYMDASPAERWRASTAVRVRQGARTHAFLVGFHRSGTTLLEQALESHPGIATLDERDFLGDASERYLTSIAGLDRLAAAGDVELDRIRETYWQSVRAACADVETDVFVDKLPFNTVKLPLIAKLFPDAKVLFTIRDPRDVVLSCFRRQFDVDIVKYEFLELPSIARLYDRTMRLGEICRQKLSLAFFEHRYEDFVGDFDGRANAVCAFLGVPWNASMRDFPATAHKSDIRSPSADQVRRGLYGEGVGRWRHYRTGIRPVLSLLQPWIARFDYPKQ
jgi:tetratricopeptide (TPR) repeat protein